MPSLLYIYVPYALYFYTVSGSIDLAVRKNHNSGYFAFRGRLYQLANLVRTDYNRKIILFPYRCNGCGHSFYISAAFNRIKRHKRFLTRNYGLVLQNAFRKGL